MTDTPHKTPPVSEVPLQSIREKLQEMFRKRKVWEMVPSCNELLVVSKDFSVKETIQILSENITTYCILIDQERNTLFSILLVADFINFLLALSGTHTHLLQDEDDMLDFLATTSIGKFLVTFKKYSDRPYEEIIHLEVR